MPIDISARTTRSTRSLALTVTTASGCVVKFRLTLTVTRQDSATDLGVVSPRRNLRDRMINALIGLEAIPLDGSSDNRITRDRKLRDGAHHFSFALGGSRGQRPKQDIWFGGTRSEG